MGEFTTPKEADGIPGLIKGQVALHRCVDKNFTLMRRSQHRRHTALDRRMKRLEEVLGTDPATPTPPALWTARKLLGWVATWGTVFFIAAKVINAALPGLLAAGVAIWQSAIH